jgi:hypothetical protein
VVLYFITINNARLGLISAFMILIALSIYFLTKAQSGHVFASTATYVLEVLFLATMLITYYNYAAVLVVFASSGLSSSFCNAAG